MSQCGEVNRLFLTLSAILLGSFVLSAQQRPLLTDDIDITPSGSIEIGVGVDFFQDSKFRLSGIEGDLTRVGNIRIRTGLAPNVEMQIEGTIQNFVSINNRTTSNIPLRVTGNSTNDFDDFISSVKVKLRSETKRIPAIGLKMGFQMPNTDQAKGIGTNQINIFTKILVQKKFGSVIDRVAKFNVFGNIGLGIYTAPLDRFTQNDMLLYGIAGIYRVNRRINLIGEINGRENTRRTNAPIGTESMSELRVGAQFRASGLRFDTAATFGLTRHTHRTGLIFGVTYLSPAFLKPAK